MAAQRTAASPRRGGRAGALAAGPMPLAARLADAVAALVGSWPFIIVQTGLLFVWIAANGLTGSAAWDPTRRRSS